MFLADTFAMYINLSHRKDRKEHMDRELERVGMYAERYRGHNTKSGVLNTGLDHHEPVIINYPIEKVKKMLMRTPGAIGCFVSQIQVMRCAQIKNQHAFVMEDDIIFCTDFHRRMRIVDQFLQNREWDIIWLGGTFHNNPSVWHTGHNPEIRNSPVTRDAECTEEPHILRTYGAFSTHAYIVNKDSIEKVTDMLYDSMQDSIGIDYSFIKLQPFLKTFAFVPGCVKQMDNQSDIGNGMTIFSNFYKLGPYWFQDRIEDFDPRTHNWAEAINQQQQKH